ncbi:metallophosphoesterase family protein [Pyrolobus fumarii]|uniref:metallophosphoesterase family protein n=1 Tax=Pyrolobus fumarii TaxID=54252 RepID=UPI0006920745|nr:metallophosphoesterase family protein [Pyrolobus fumarii]
MARRPIEYLELASEIAQNPDDLLDTVEHFVETIDEQREEGDVNGVRLYNHVVIAQPREPIVVIGDVHGDAETLEEILRDPDTQHALETGYVVFLGDYVDRGPHQLETILAPMLMYVENPDHVIMLRGNHEPLPELIPYPHDFPFHLKIRFPEAEYSGFAEKLYQTFLEEVFPRLPDAAIIEGRVFLVHGGPPVTLLEAGSWIEGLAADRYPAPLEILEELLWNDPCDCEADYMPNPRGAGKLWGPRVTERTLELTSTKLIVRGHEAVDEGYKFDHNNKVLTLFSRLGEPYGNQRAAYLVLRFMERWYERENLEKMLKIIEME